jgi:hypothetical protein
MRTTLRCGNRSNRYDPLRSGRTLPVLGILLLAAGCGGGGGSGASSSGSGQSYEFVRPPINSVRSYSETVVDNSNNTIDEGFTVTVTAVNSDGTYAELSEDPSHSSVTVNGTTYSIPTETQSFNASGQETSYVYMAANDQLLMCTYDPHGDGPDFPLSVGYAWTLDFTYSCGSGSSISYSQMGSVVDVESVTVPAGTYSAIKLQSTVTWTNSAGTTRTQTITNWRDVVTSVSVKQEISIAYSGTIPTTGYVVSREILLQTSS